MKNKVLCIVPALPARVRFETLQSIIWQTVPVNMIVLLTQKGDSKLPFPARMSKVINDELTGLCLEQFDWLLRVDDDVVLPPSFLEENLKLNMDVLGYGPAQLIRVSSFLRVMGGRLHRWHDDGYVNVKFRQVGLRESLKYAVKPVLMRQDGVHNGSGYFVAQGELHYRYGVDPAGELLMVLKCWRRVFPFGTFYLLGYFLGLLRRRERFDVAPLILQGCFRKYARLPWQLFKSRKVKNYVRGWHV